MAQIEHVPGERTSYAPAVEAVVVLVIGVLLAFVDLLSDADAQLRVPALIASLALVGDSINNLRPFVARVNARSIGGEPVTVDTGQGEPTPVGQERPPPSQLVPLTLMGLAIWLGIATLMHSDAEMQLLVLSLIASFFIISRGLRDLPAR
jgi:hypothetical protein